MSGGEFSHASGGDYSHASGGEAVITLAALCRELGRINEAELRRWITAEWVRPARRQPEPLFGAIDVARVRLIVELRDEMEVGDAAMPVVLSLLDQLYEARRQMRRLCGAVERQGGADFVGGLRALLAADATGG